MIKQEKVVILAKSRIVYRGLYDPKIQILLGKVTRMWLDKTANLLRKIVAPMSHWFHNVALVVLFVMMMLTVTDVSLRFFLNSPISGSLELTEYMMAIVVGLSLSYCALKKENIRVDLVVERFPVRAQTIIDVITGFFSLGLISLIAWRTSVQAQIAFGSHTKSLIFHIPSYPFVAILSLGIAMLTLVLLVDFIEYLAKAVKK